MSNGKLLGVVPSSHRSEVWVSLEFRSGHLFLTFAEQEHNRRDGRKQKPPVLVRATEFPALRSAIDAAEAELRKRGFLQRLPNTQAGEGPRP